MSEFRLHQLSQTIRKRVLAAIGMTPESVSQDKLEYVVEKAVKAALRRFRRPPRRPRAMQP
jgi:hypothetical protein